MGIADKFIILQINAFEALHPHKRSSAISRGLLEETRDGQLPAKKYWRPAFSHLPKVRVARYHESCRMRAEFQRNRITNQLVKFVIKVKNLDPLKNFVQKINLLAE